MVAVATAVENWRTQSISCSVSSGVAQQAIGCAMYGAVRLPAAVASSGTRDTAPPCRNTMPWVIGEPMLRPASRYGSMIASSSAARCRPRW